jgi:serine/threonine protein kinase
LEAADYDPDYTNRKIDSAHNVWAFGCVMHELFTMDAAGDFSKVIDNMTEAQNFAQDDNAIEKIRTRKTPEYSQPLRDLVRNSLKLRPSARPTPEQILEVTSEALKHFEQQALSTKAMVPVSYSPPDWAYQIPRVWYRENEINTMPLGPHFPEKSADLKRLAAWMILEDEFAEPVWGPLLHPRRHQFKYFTDFLIANENNKVNSQGKRPVAPGDQSESGPTSTSLPPSEERPEKKRKLLAPKPANVRKPQKKKRILIRGNPFAPTGQTRVDTPAPFQPRNPQPQQGGFIAINTQRGQFVERQAREGRQQEQPSRQEIMEAFKKPGFEAKAKKNVAAKNKRQLWQDPPPMIPFPRALESGERLLRAAMGEDTSMGDS